MRNLAQLLATYEELHDIPPESRITLYTPDMRRYIIDAKTTPRELGRVTGLALDALGISLEEFENESAYCNRQNIVADMCENSNIPLPQKPQARIKKTNHQARTYMRERIPFTAKTMKGKS